MKNYINPEFEIMLLQDGDIVTFSIGELESLDPSGTNAPVVDIPSTDEGIASNFKQ